MPIAIGLQTLINLVCAIHVYKTGRPYWWIGIILMVPAFGALAYLLFEVIPHAGGSRHVKRVIKHFDPGVDLRARLVEVERCGSIQNKAALADELINTGQFQDAIRLYQSALEGSYADDIHLQFGLANAYFCGAQPAQAIDLLDKVIAREAWYKSGDAKLIRARALEACGQTQAALEQYQSIADVYSGEEARSRLILLLLKLERQEQARKLFEEMEKKVRLAPPYYRREQREFIDSAANAIADTEAAERAAQ